MRCRAREQASDFNAALSDYLQGVRRTQEAQRLRKEYESLALERKAAAADEAPLPDLALVPGQTMTLRIKAVRSHSWSQDLRCRDGKNDEKMYCNSARSVLLETLSMKEQGLRYSNPHFRHCYWSLTSEAGLLLAGG